jgi:hypothetical protein
MPRGHDDEVAPPDFASTRPSGGASSPDGELTGLMAMWGKNWQLWTEFGMWFGRGRIEHDDGSFTLTGPLLAASSADALDRELAVAEAYAI